MLLDSKKCILLAFIPFSLALDCTSSNAIAWPESGSGSGSSSTCGRLCGNDEGCLALCDRRKLKTRATLSCTGTEACMLYTDNTLFCIDVVTTAFHDENGGKGNLAEGVYTDASGQAATVAVEGTASPAASTTKSAAATVLSTSTSSSLSPSSPSSSASSSGTSVLVQSTSASRTSTSAGGAPAATTPASGVEKLGGRSSVYGVLGLVVGILVN